ncbi:MAG: VWA domain-containing protein [Leptolyngbyaceae cyanobacterium SL_1_1]|nr:VWA domain-containing protein [Leptolyngbyaceae cyanobacterium RM1_1_2]NJO11114.1 VWA domain-containing protein [Leptolyngbyaceae cyanobacterium SL_1_1]
MLHNRQHWLPSLSIVLSLAALVACGGTQTDPSGLDDGTQTEYSGFEIKFLVGSALADFCTEAAEQFNQQKPQLETGEAFYLSCEATGSGDVVSRTVSLAEQFKAGALPADSPEFPTLLSVDGEIYQSQLIYRMEQIFPGQNYVPAITDAPLLVYSPMVFMTPQDLAPSLQGVQDLFQALTTADTYKDLNAASPAQKIYYVHTAPTRSNSGLQTLVAQFASVSGKRPEDLSVADVGQFQADVKKIQNKITRYGTSTNSLAKSMAQNGPFWASIGSVYESSVISVNSQLQPGQTPFQAVYPKATFTSNMRGILPSAPWVSDLEQQAAEQFLTYLQTPETQAIAVELGLRPGTPGVPLGDKFSAQFGVDPDASYDSYRPPAPEVVEAMLTSWQAAVKKPSLVVVVVDSSGSMRGDKLPAVQNTLQTYIDSLSPQDQIALIDFDDVIREPFLVEGSPNGRDRGLQFISSLRPDGGTRLYDASLEARNWLSQNLRPDAINAVLVLTDGEDSGSDISLEQLSQELQQSGFDSDQRIAFFTVGYGNAGDFSPEVLEQIAELNGGYYSQGDPATIANLMSNLQLEF